MTDLMDIDQTVEPSCVPEVLRVRISSGFDLKEYAEGFLGVSKIQALLFLSEQCQGEAIAMEALQLAHDDIKAHSLDIDLYRQVIDAMNQHGTEEYTEDPEWLESSDSKFFSLQSEIETALVSAKTALDQKEIARLEGELGDLLRQRGLSLEALKHYMRMREYSKDLEDILTMTQKVVVCAYQMKNYFSVLNHSKKVDAMLDAGECDPFKVAQIRLTAALTNMVMGKFELAAREGVHIGQEHLQKSHDIVSSSTYAIGIIFSALASLDRKALSDMMNKPGFQELVNLGPRDAYDAFTAVQGGHYGEALSLLEVMKPRLWIDPVLSTHITSLYSMIHDRCLCEYSSAFSVIQISFMAQKFNMKTSDLEERLANLIRKGKIKAKINASTSELKCQRDSPLEQAYSSVLDAAQTFERNAKHLILRSQMLRYGIVKASAMRGMDEEMEDEAAPRAELSEHE